MKRRLAMFARLDRAALLRGTLAASWLRLVRRRAVTISLPQFYGPGSRIAVRLGSRVSFGRGISTRGPFLVFVDGGYLAIGEGCFFNTNCSITSQESVTIGRHCSFGPNLVIVDHDHDFRSPLGGFSRSAVSIGERVWVGANVVILRGSVIGDGAVVGAGSIVRGTIPANHVYTQGRETTIKKYGA